MDGTSGSGQSVRRGLAVLREVEGVSDFLWQLIDNGGEVDVYKLRPLRSSLRAVYGSLVDNLDALDAIRGEVRV